MRKALKHTTAASGTDPVLFGDQSIESTSDFNTSGSAEAFPFTNQTTGTAMSIFVYVDSGSLATTLVVGVYSDRNGHPGSRLTSGSLASPKAGAWNTVTVSSAAVTAGRAYWVAVLGKGGALYFRDRLGGPCASESAAQSTLSSLPSSWTSGPQWNTCPISAYVMGTVPTGAKAPSNTGLPQLSGTTTQTQTLSTSNGTWTGSPTGYSYQWQDCDTSGNACINTSGATSNGHMLTSSDVGHTLRAVVTATNTGGSTQATSGASAVVASDAPPPPSNTALPATSGATTQGQIVSTSNGTWTGSPTGYTYQWQDCNSLGTSCTSASGAISSSYMLTSSDVGHTMRVLVIATNAGGAGSATSLQTAVVAAASQSTGVLFGDQNLASYGDNNGAGVAQAFSYTAAASGTTSDIQLFVNSGTTATTLFLGVYSDASGKPGSLLGSGSLSSPQAGAWNDVTVGPATITQGNTYWIALLGTGGQLNYPDTSGGSGASYVESSTGLTSLPATYASGTQYTVSPASTYVKGVLGSGGSAPTDTALPALSGTAQQGQLLSTTNGTWTGSPTGYTYQWRQCDSSANNCTNVNGATSSGYTLASADVGHTMRAVVSASNPGGSTSATSAASAVVVSGAPPPPPSNTALPAISGTTTQGQVLSTSNGSWTGSPIGYTYQWRQCDNAGNNCTNISGATASSYTLASGDVGQTIRSVVTASNAGGSTPAASPASAVISSNAPPPPSNTALPAISGATIQGQMLSTSNGSWTGSPTGYTYQWRQCDTSGNSCTNVGGATANSYMLTSTDVGHEMRAVDTASNSGGSTPATSVQTSTVVSSAGTGTGPGYTAQPVVSGDLEQGQVLSSTNGSWSSSPSSFSYQWEDCSLQGLSCSLIGGASGSTYAIQSSDKGFTIRSIVTATNGSGSTPMYSGATGIATGACTQTFNSGNIGSSPYAGSSLNSAVGGAAAGSVFCLTNNVGQVDIYNNPAGKVYIEAAPGVAASAAGGTYDINGSAGGASNITVENQTAGGLIHCNSDPHSGTCNVSGDQVLNNILSSAVHTEDVTANSNIYLARNSAVNLNADTSQGTEGGLATYPAECPSGVTIAHNYINGVAADGIDNNSDCGTQILSNIIENVTQSVGPVGCIEHCDGWQDNGNSQNVVMDGNLFLHDTDCWLSDDLDTNLTITNNVCSVNTSDSGYWAQFGGVVTEHFSHNTILSTSGGQVGNSGAGVPSSNHTYTNNIEVTPLQLNPGQPMGGTLTEDYNLCGGSGISCGSGAHDRSGTPTLVGGANPGENWSGYQLTAGSAGHNAASDGTDMGVSTSYFNIGSMTNPSGKIPGLGG